MRNYIILNGVHSDTIPGLLIQSLAPITKPKIRTQIEEIDGRDGDIVTKLGYGAYDKELSIGLSYNYDIDQIISYFNSQGTVIFSNEEDKYYNYQILDQIDFERLLRYKTAIVKLHVQPFKYSAEDNTKTYSINNGDNSISIRNSGNIYSKPSITIVGEGNIQLSLNGIQAFSIALGNLGQITIDATNMEAYNSITGQLLNRNVTGSYDNFNFKVGLNEVSWTVDESISEITISNFSRWI